MRDPLRVFSDTQIWILNALCIVVIFLLGLWLGTIRDETEEPIVPPKVLPVATGEFEDVEMEMTSSSGTFRWLCDLHLQADSNHAECEYRQ